MTSNHCNDLKDDIKCPKNEMYDNTSQWTTSDEKKAMISDNKWLPFLEKTYHMIENSPKHLASWSDSGSSFVVYDPDSFALEVIPKYFKHQKFSSFVRQLNFYGFRKTKASSFSAKRARKINQRHQGPPIEREFWEFAHPRFIRGQFSLIKTIRRRSLVNDLEFPGHERDCCSCPEASVVITNLSLELNEVKHRMISMQIEFNKLFKSMRAIEKATSIPTNDALTLSSNMNLRSSRLSAVRSVVLDDSSDSSRSTVVMSEDSFSDSFSGADHSDVSTPSPKINVLSDFLLTDQTTNHGDSPYSSSQILSVDENDLSVVDMRFESF